MTLARSFISGGGPTPLVRCARLIVESAAFNRLVVAIILLNALLIGASTYSSEVDTLHLLGVLEHLCLLFYCVEILLRFISRESSRTFFRDAWTIFDLIIIFAAFIPASSGIGPVLRVLRVFRVLRLVKTIPELRLIVTVLVRSVVSMKHVGLLAAILFYVYAVIGVKLFGTATHPMQPYFSSIHEACFTLFRVLTGDGWTQMRYDLGGAGHPLGAMTAYLVSWIIIATFLLVNLIVGAVINNYQKVQEIEDHQARAPDTSEARLRKLVQELQSILEARREHTPSTNGHSSAQPPH